MNAILLNPKVKSTIHTLVLWSPLWIGCCLLCFALSTVYCFGFKKNVWLASQALTLRDETAGATMRLGRFESSTQLKAAQEMVLDLARNQQVIRNAFMAVGPDASVFGTSSEWPTNRDIKEFADQSLSVHAPRGAEFGATETVYLDVKHTNPQRAIQLTKAMCDSLEDYMRQVRENRAQSIVEEVTQAREKARSELAKATKRLQEIERSIGSDLPDLRSMVEVGGGSSSRTALEQLRQEARQLDAKRQDLETELQMLTSAAANPAAFISAPGSLLNSQPGLKRLREGLVDAQLTQAQLSGKFTDDHPSVTAAKSAVSDITARLNFELQAALQNAKQSLASCDASKSRLDAQEKNLEERMDRLAESRAIYANIVAEVRTRANILEQTERELAEAEASRISSQSTSLVTRVDSPVLSDRPVGPGKTTIIAGATMGGLMLGLGLVTLIHPLLFANAHGRRWSDNAGFGRRAEDRTVDRASAFLAADRISHAVTKPLAPERPAESNQVSVATPLPVDPAPAPATVFAETTSQPVVPASPIPFPLWPMERHPLPTSKS